MRPDPSQPYYTAYDKRYKAVYAQGVQYWTARPEELSDIECTVDSFLKAFHLQASESLHVVEFGCGEGYVGELLLQRGYRYTGLDIVESAVKKAAARLARFGDRATHCVHPNHLWWLRQSDPFQNMGRLSCKS